MARLKQTIGVSTCHLSTTTKFDKLMQNMSRILNTLPNGVIHVCNTYYLSFAFIIALSAQGLVFILFAKEYALFVLYDAV